MRAGRLLWTLKGGRHPFFGARLDAAIETMGDQRAGARHEPNEVKRKRARVAKGLGRSMIVGTVLSGPRVIVWLDDVMAQEFAGGAGVIACRRE